MSAMSRPTTNLETRLAVAESVLTDLERNREEITHQIMGEALAKLQQSLETSDNQINVKTQEIQQLKRSIQLQNIRSTMYGLLPVTAHQSSNIKVKSPVQSPMQPPPLPHNRSVIASPQPLQQTDAPVNHTSTVDTSTSSITHVPWPLSCSASAHNSVAANMSSKKTKKHNRGQQPINQHSNAQATASPDTTVHQTATINKRDKKKKDQDDPPTINHSHQLAIKIRANRNTAAAVAATITSVPSSSAKKSRKRKRKESIQSDRNIPTRNNSVNQRAFVPHYHPFGLLKVALDIDEYSLSAHFRDSKLEYRPLPAVEELAAAALLLIWCNPELHLDTVSSAVPKSMRPEIASQYLTELRFWEEFKALKALSIADNNRVYGCVCQGKVVMCAVNRPSHNRIHCYPQNKNRVDQMRSKLPQTFNALPTKTSAPQLPRGKHPNIFDMFRSVNFRLDATSGDYAANLSIELIEYPTAYDFAAISALNAFDMTWKADKSDKWDGTVEHRFMIWYEYILKRRRTKTLKGFVLGKTNNGKLVCSTAIHNIALDSKDSNFYFTAEDHINAALNYWKYRDYIASQRVFYLENFYVESVEEFSIHRFVLEWIHNRREFCDRCIVTELPSRAIDCWKRLHYVDVGKDELDTEECHKLVRLPQTVMQKIIHSKSSSASSSSDFLGPQYFNM